MAKRGERSSEDGWRVSRVVGEEGQEEGGGGGSLAFLRLAFAHITLSKKQNCRPVLFRRGVVPSIVGHQSN